MSLSIIGHISAAIPLSISLSSGMLNVPVLGLSMHRYPLSFSFDCNSLLRGNIGTTMVDLYGNGHVKYLIKDFGIIGIFFSLQSLRRLFL